MNYKRNEEKLSSPLVSRSFCTIFKETVHEIQATFCDLLEFISNFHHENVRKQCIVDEKRYA